MSKLMRSNASLIFQITGDLSLYEKLILRLFLDNFELCESMIKL